MTHCGGLGAQQVWDDVRGIRGTIVRGAEGSALTPVERQTFCPYKGLCSYYNIGDVHLAVWSYPEAYPEVGRISNFLSFEPDIVSVQLDGKQLHLEPGLTVIPHGPIASSPSPKCSPAANRHERALGDSLRRWERRDVTVTTPKFSVEVITLPVSNVERALRFYVDQGGFTFDVDYSPNDAFRVVQLTPPGSSWRCLS